MPLSSYWIIEADVNIRGMRRGMQVRGLSSPTSGWAATSSFYRPRGGSLQLCRVALGIVSRYRHVVLVI
jgi:hypothetical protein